MFRESHNNAWPADKCGTPDERKLCFNVCSSARRIRVKRNYIWMCDGSRPAESDTRQKQPHFYANSIIFLRIFENISPVCECDCVCPPAPRTYFDHSDMLVSFLRMLGKLASGEIVANVCRRMNVRACVAHIAFNSTLVNSGRRHNDRSGTGDVPGVPGDGCRYLELWRSGWGDGRPETVGGCRRIDM